jgi:hypothetical protein
MTEKLLAQAQDIQNNIQNIDKLLYSIKRIKLREQKGQRKPYLKFVNALKHKNGKEIREATVYLFDGVNMYGTEVPVDERLLNCLEEHYALRLEEAKAEFDAM